jgi:hypothetical protein
MQRRLLLIFMLMLVVAASAYAQVGRQQRNQAAISRAGLSIRQQAEELPSADLLITRRAAHMFISY